MSTNGNCRPPRPQLSVAALLAKPDEAAAIAAALERFLIEVAPRVAATQLQTSGWQRRAMLEAVGVEEVSEMGSGW